MTTPHRATPEQWADAGAFRSDTRACLLELRARVAAAEQRISELENLRQQDEDAERAVEPAAPAGSLVERVRTAIVEHGDGETYTDEARAAIYEVANWLEQFEFVGAVQALREEADR